MAWWKRFIYQEKVESRELKTPEVDVKDVDKVKNVSLRKLNDKDKEAIHKLERELLAAGVLAPREEAIEITDRLEDILKVAYEQGLANVQDLVGDFELDERISSGTGGNNLMLDEIDDYEDTVYDLYEEGKTSTPGISVEADNRAGDVALRLPDGSIHYGKIPDEK